MSLFVLCNGRRWAEQERTSLEHSKEAEEEEDVDVLNVTVQTYI